MQNQFFFLKRIKRFVYANSSCIRTIFRIYEEEMKIKWKTNNHKAILF